MFSFLWLVEEWWLLFGSEVTFADWFHDVIQKEREFFKHVQKYRPNAGYSSTTNPLPDWYGEKIGSLREYRTWLKDQRAFNKKREVNLI